MKRSFVSLIFLLLTFSLSAQVNNQIIDDFIVKENLSFNNQLAIIATDSSGNSNEFINGTFSFQINGFKQELRFKNGIAISELNIDESTFVFIKHVNESKNPSKLFYIYKSDIGLKPFTISAMWLIAIPLALILVGYLFRKLIGLAIFILLAVFYFYYSKGLSVGTMLESIISAIKGLF